ncbi:MAG: class I SAM-dependent methyltransferase [Gemmatimonadetes bacterium]|nr:class I SAM-dependent methyltransferase [Gemmatimonadota bacterium]
MLKGSDEWVKRKDYAETFYKRASGALPEMESSKAVANLLAGSMRANDSILDVGCGAGHYLRSMLQRIKVPFKYTGVDATSDFIDAAHRAWKDQPGAVFRLGDVYDLPFRDGQFDIVMCNNVLLHLPSVGKPVRELVRVSKRLVLIRTLIGERSYRVQEVYSKDNWPFSDVSVENEFGENGEPISFGFENIYSKGYFEALVRRANPDVKIDFVQDTSFDAETINRSADSEGLPNPTRVINGMQVFGYIILPWHFVFIRLPE